MFTKQFLRTLSILLCKAHVEICFDIYSAAHLPIQSGGILNASIYPNPAKSPVGHTAVLRAAATAALIQSTGPDALVPSISSKRGQVVLLVPVFIFQRPPHCCIPALLLHVYIKTSGRAVSSLSLSPMNRVAGGDTTELAKTDTHKPLRRECEKFPKISRGALM